jgi:peptidoglycan/LPS O-acetylase OafA/YrhL
MTPTEAGLRRSTAIDVLKGVAIAGVILQHALTPYARHEIYASLHAGLAVPVFVLLTGLNLSRSWSRDSGQNLRASYSSRYLERRLGRLVPPFIVAWLAALMLGGLLDRLAISPQMLVGSFPMPGPGDYYIPVLFQVVLLTPLIAWTMSRRPALMLVVCFAIDAAFELAATRVQPLWSFLSTGGHFRYDVIGLRYLGVLALGIWLGLRARRARELWWIWPFAVLSIAYLLLEQTHWTEQWLGLPPGFERRTNLLAVGLAAAWVLLGLATLDRLWARLAAPVAELGRASYHVYLVQIVWFGVFPEESWPRFALALVACSLIGLAFYRLLPGGLPARRRRSVERPAVS